MDLRLAVISDLQELKDVYGKIIEYMNHNDIQIWDEIYPCEFFTNDIDNGSLYVLTNENKSIAGAFALCESNAGENHVKREKDTAKSLYIDRLGVSVNFLKQGIGGILLDHATEIAKEKNAEYLRLFVVDMNKPAINLYLKNDFMQADGIYEERIDEGFVLYEYGFEKKI